MNDEPRLRKELAAAARKLSAAGMNIGRSGNLSARVEGGFVITPSGVAYDKLDADAMVHVQDDGKPLAGQRTPSSEWRMHRDIYARFPAAGAVVHSHSPYATTLACLGRGIPSFHYEIAFAGGADIRCAPYATFGTQELSDGALKALEGRRACLLGNHGAMAWGEDIESAVGLAEKVEALARLYWQALQVGDPLLLSQAEMDLMVEKFKTYGRG